MWSSYSTATISRDSFLYEMLICVSVPDVKYCWPCVHNKNRVYCQVSRRTLAKLAHVLVICDIGVNDKTSQCGGTIEKAFVIGGMFTENQLCLLFSWSRMIKWFCVVRLFGEHKQCGSL